MSALKELQEYTFISKYARWLPDKKRRETWTETVDRVRNMMLEKYKDKGIDDEINWAYDMMFNKKVLGSGRSLQFGGKPIFQHNERMYNCFHKNTKFITNIGTCSFKDFNDGDIITVLTHKGNWKKAVVKNYNKQQLYKIIIKRASLVYEIYATKNHRWIKKNGNITSELKIQDKLAHPPNIFVNFDYDNAPIDEKLYWAYGFVYGDGTCVKNKNGEYKASMVRLCGYDRKYKYRFEELSFKTSQPLSMEGDFIAYTGSYLKTTPNPHIDEPRLIKAFVRGYLDADGHKNRSCKKYKTNTNYFIEIQSSEIKHINFIRKCFPIAGVYIIKEEDLTGQKTNFGIRPYTIKFRICNYLGLRAAQFRVINIEKDVIDDVWCLEVEEDKSFMLPFGLPTGNCTASYCDRLSFFQEAMFLLLCGCGVGMSLQNHHVRKLPNLINLNDVGDEKKYVIPDTISGWADSLGVLLSTYHKNNVPFPEYIGKKVKFDYSAIRPAGSYLSSSSTTAPGSKQLKQTHQSIEKLLKKIITQNQKKLLPINCLDIFAHASDAVLCGAIRRSAGAAIFDINDQEMLNAKIGNWIKENPQRARVNISIVFLRDQTKLIDFRKIIDNIKHYAEPGFYLTDSTEITPNPCFEIGLYPIDIETNKSGFQGCNLSTINCASIENEEDFYERCRAAALIGTLQSGFTNFSYLNKTSENIFNKERLIGVSMTGIMDKPDIVLNPNVQKKGAKVIKQTNKHYAAKIGINQAARTTTVKPEGTSSCLLGTSSGLHPHHAKRYIRRVQNNSNEKPYQHFKQNNSHTCEKSIWGASGDDENILFPIEVPIGSKTKNQLPALDMLVHIKNLQKNWINSGVNKELCMQPWLSHSVSNTVIVNPDEWNNVATYIYNNRSYFAGISLISSHGDLDFPQPPFTAVHMSHEIVSKYNQYSIWTSGLIEHALQAFDDNLWAACDFCLIPEQRESAEKLTLKDRRKARSEVQKLEFYDRMVKFANKWVDKDIRTLTYCMKDVYNWKLYCELKDSFKPVDYTQMIEEQDNTNFEGEIACGGGACEL